MAESQAAVETPAEPIEAQLDPDQPVSVEIGDRVLTGVGETEAELRAGLVETPSEPRKPKRGQKRFDELTFEREEAERKATAAEARAKELEAKLAALEKPAPIPQTPPAPRPQPPAAPPAQPVATRTKPSEDEVGSKYATYGEYVEDLADWKAEQRLAAVDFDARIRTSIEADRASRTAAERESESIKRGRAAYGDDFDATMKAPHFYDGQWPAFVRDAIAGLDAPEHVYYQLGKDPALAQRIRTLDPVRLGMELARLTGTAGASSASPALPVVSLPPPPMQPVGSGSKTTALSPSELAERGTDDYDSSGFREALRANRRR